MMYAQIPQNAPQLDETLPLDKRKSLFNRLGLGGIPNPSDGTTPTFVRQGEPLRNDTSATSAATNPQPEINTSPNDWVGPQLPPESQGYGGGSTTDQLAPLSGIEKQIADNNSRMATDPSMQPPTQRIDPSTGRKILANVAGIGVGMLNPERGLALRQSILDQPTLAAQQAADLKRAPLEQQNDRAFKLAGITQQDMQRQAELRQARAAQDQAQNKANEETRLQGEVQPINYGTGRPGETQEGVIPKFGGTGAAARPTPVGAPKVAKQTQDQVQLVKDSKGQYFAVDKEHPDQPMPVPGVVDAPTEQAFNSYWQALPPAERTAEAAMKWQVAGAAQYGINEVNKVKSQQELVKEAESMANAISNDPEVLKEKDPARAFAAAERLLERFMLDNKDYTGQQKAIRDSLQQRMLKYNKSPKSGSGISVIIPKNGNVTVNQNK